MKSEPKKQDKIKEELICPECKQKFNMWEMVSKKKIKQIIRKSGIIVKRLFCGTCKRNYLKLVIK